MKMHLEKLIKIHNIHKKIILNKISLLITIIKMDKKWFNFNQ